MELREENQDWAAIPSLPENFPMNIKRNWSIGTIPHGGYLLSIAVLAAREDMQSQQSSMKRPDLVTSPVEFVSRTAIGPGTFSVTPLKIGRQFSTLRVRLLQQDRKSKQPRLCFEALITQGTLASQSPASTIVLPVLPLHFSVPKRIDCRPWDFDPRWPSRRPAAWKVSRLFPPNTLTLLASPSDSPSAREQWLHWDSPKIGTHFTIDSLPYLADNMRPLPEAYGLVGNWYPTLSYGVEVKRAPEKKEGWEWLFTRFEMGEVINGRFGMNVWILDEQERLVAKSWHTVLIMVPPPERNYVERVVEGAKI